MLSLAQADAVIRALKDASAAVKQLSASRLLFRTPEDLRKSVADLNRRIAAHAAASGSLEKLQLMRHAAVRQEIRTLQAALMQVLPVVKDAAVRSAWRLRVDAGTIQRHCENALSWLDKFHHDVDDHEALVREGVTDEKTEKLEYSILVRYEQYKQKLIMGIDNAVSMAEAEYAVDPGRRNFLGTLIKVAAGVVLSSSGLEALAQDVAKAEGGKGAAKATELTDEQIKELMKYETVDEILKEDKVIKASVEFVKYDSEKKTTNFDELVYQKALKAEERKPVLVLFYHNKDPPNPSVSGTSLRSAIVIKNLANEFGGQMKFVCYEADTDPQLSANGYAGVFKQFGVLSIPSTAIYSTFDVLKGETPSKNDGVIKMLDVARGGALEDKFIAPSFRNARNYWIATNLLFKQSPKTDGQVYRYNNDWKLKAVAKSELLVKE